MTSDHDSPPITLPISYPLLTNSIIYASMSCTCLTFMHHAIDSLIHKGFFVDGQQIAKLDRLIKEACLTRMLS